MAKSKSAKSKSGDASMADIFRRSVSAGMAICLGAAAFLSCENKVVGSFMFCIGLYCICAFSLNLFTGKIGYVLDNKNPLTCLVIWLGNLCGCFLFALPLRIVKPDIALASSALTEKKLSVDMIGVFALAFLCGVLVYIAVENFRESESGFGKVIGILLAIPAFIICGFEHSIADMCYFIMGIGSASQLGRAMIFILVCSVGNGLGSIVFRLLSAKLKPKKKSNA